MEKARHEMIHDLCSRIVAEQNQQKFRALVEELHRVLSADDKGLRDDVSESSNV
jgi:hypothetical protein